MAFSMESLISPYCTMHSSILNNSKAVKINPLQITEKKSKILTLMASLLNSEDPEIYTLAVSGLVKLYMTGHVSSTKLLSKLIIMYYSPMTLNDVKLRACLSCFLPNFAFLRLCNQVCVEKAFMIVLKSLIDAPLESGLSKIDLFKVMEVMFYLTSAKNFLQRRNNQPVIEQNNICHEKIVTSICLEILKEGDSSRVKTYLKVLNMADLTNAEFLSLNSIYELVNNIQTHITSKNLLSSAFKFKKNVMALMNKKQKYLEEQRWKKEKERGVTEHNETVNETQSLVNDNETGTTQLNLTKIFTSTTSNNRLSMSEDMIDLDFKKLGRERKKLNLTLGVTMIEESNVTKVADGIQVARKDEQVENAVVEITIGKKRHA